MNLDRRPATLEALDTLEADALLLFLSREARPPKGVAGLVDWRMAGALSRFVARGWMEGRSGEMTLSPGRGRLEGLSLVTCGVGEGTAVTEVDLQRTVERACQALTALGVRTLACGLPEFGEDPVGLGAAIERTLRRVFSGSLVLLEPER